MLVNYEEDVFCHLHFNHDKSDPACVWGSIPDAIKCHGCFKSSQLIIIYANVYVRMHLHTLKAACGLV